MAVTRTFSIIKPDATRRNLTGAVTKMLEEAGLRVVASKRIHMTRNRPKASTRSTRNAPSSANWSNS
jgi:nucleoside-diphosphate kinase